MYKAAIIGATGYTGHELIKILENHPSVDVTYITSTSQVGKKIKHIYPDLISCELELELFSINSIKEKEINIVFLAVPHGKAMQFVPELLDVGVKVIDLSADFRIKDLDVYQATYGSHSCPEILNTAVYGLPEFYREQIKNAQLIANPGCYVTSSLLALYPIKKIVDNIIIDAKSGVTGAGKKAVEGLLFSEVSNGFKAYKIAGHRHQPEIEAYLGQNIEFVPHLLPVNRGILSTIYFQSQESYEILHSKLIDFYTNSRFVNIVEDTDININMVIGTNKCLIALYQASKSNQFIITSVLDNLIKGASGQAIQNMNLMLGLDETTGLDLIVNYP